jgi:hypothetical protein
VQAIDAQYSTHSHIYQSNGESSIWGKVGDLTLRGRLVTYLADVGHLNRFTADHTLGYAFRQKRLKSTNEDTDDLYVASVDPLVSYDIACSYQGNVTMRLNNN